MQIISSVISFNQLVPSNITIHEINKGYPSYLIKKHETVSISPNREFFSREVFPIPGIFLEVGKKSGNPEVGKIFYDLLKIII